MQSAPDQSARIKDTGHGAEQASNSEPGLQPCENLGTQGWINGQRVEWLPSVPVVKKHKIPPIAGYGILYSEEMEQTLHVFKSENLAKGLDEQWRAQAVALNTDPNCRFYWLATAETDQLNIESNLVIG